MLDPLDLARSLAADLITLPGVRAVALGGSRAAAIVNPAVPPDATSDIDLYAYTDADVPEVARLAFVGRWNGGDRPALGAGTWGPGDEWRTPSGIVADVVHFGADWMADQVDRVLVRHEPSLGTSTCFWHTVGVSVALEDPTGWFGALQARSRVPYPEPLRAAIVRYNHPVLRGIVPSWSEQVAKAAARGDLVSINHRLSGLVASVFDILFALNRVAHPGEKRLLAIATERCPRLPVGFAADLTELLETATVDLAGLPSRVGRLLDRLDALLVDEGLLPC